MAPLALRRYIFPLTHALLWALLGVTLLLIQPLTWRITIPVQFWIKQMSLFGMWLALFYLNTEVAVPRLLFKGRTGWFILLMIVLVIAVVLLNKLVETSLHLPELMTRAFHPDEPNRRPKSSWFDMGSLFVSLLVVGISTSVATVQKWQKDLQIRRDLEQQQTSSELSFLKAQINPHFFFNTLNNIYALTVVNGELARQAIHTLSRMMRYVLYETQAPTTLLSKEVVFVQDYIDLMQLRLTDKVKITFEKPATLVDVPVAPMLLLPFVENAFKHGISAVLPSHIHIILRQQDATLDMEVRNTTFPDKRPNVEESNGIGLTNTRRRLDLLYPNRYQLAVQERTPEQEFRVHLTLQVA